ncbi:MAG: AraC family transcriptional regulator [Hyphomicrobiales bacterium]
MTIIDRLSALMARFELSVRPSDSPLADMTIFADVNTGLPTRLVLCPHENIENHPEDTEIRMFMAQINWGGKTNPLFSALPNKLEIMIEEQSDVAAIANLLKMENENKRCGSASVLSRLAEILLIRLLRVQIETGDLEVGLFGGLNDPRLSRAIVAMHDNPSKKWKNDELAQIAGLSLSRFCEVFANIVQETPIAYLRRWRLILARQEIIKGARIQDIAAEFGYQSGEALTRAFHNQFGETPTNMRQRYLNN